MSNANVFMTSPRRCTGRRPHQHGNGNDEARLVAQREMSLADAELATQGAAALRVDDLRLPELVRQHADVAHPDAVREPRAERLDDRFFRGEPHREEPHGALGLREQRELFVEQQPAGEVLAEPLPRLLDALRLQDVGADTEDHARAATMSAFILATAPAKPSNSACATIAWPMLSSTIAAHRRDRRHVVVVQPVAGVHDEPESASARGRRLDTRELARRAGARSPRRTPRCAARRPARPPPRSPRSARSPGR